MKKYDPNAKCPKCGAGGVSCKSISCWGEPAPWVSIKTRYNRTTNTITHTCDGCGFSWDEEPLDEKEDNDA